MAALRWGAVSYERGTPVGTRVQGLGFDVRLEGVEAGAGDGEDVAP